MELEKKSYKVRLPEAIAQRVEDEARGAGLAPTTLLQTTLCERFGGTNGGRVVASGHSHEAARLSPAHSVASSVTSDRDFLQLIYEIAKTRSLVLHLASETIGDDTLDDIIAAATRDAKTYAAEVEQGRKQVERTEGDDADDG